MRPVYRVEYKIAGFDFFPWLLLQKAAGATEVVFDLRKPKTDKYTLPEVLRRIESILLPGPALAGLPYSIGPEGDDPVPGHQQDLCDFVNEGGVMPRLFSPLPPGNERYTVTLRRTGRWLHRNSDEDVWRAFADEIGARVIEDYEVEPIHLHERMALYAGAEMNWFVTNGPVMLCFLSEYPAMGCDVGQAPMTNLGIPMGDSYPFLMPDRHFQIYEPPTLENLRRHFHAWRAAQNRKAEG